MKRRILCAVLATFFLLTGVAVYAETMPDIQAHKTCKYCGMDRDKFAHSRMLTEYTDGTREGTCSIHCAAVDLALNLDKTPKALKVGDYKTKELIDAETATWLIGGKKPGVMTKNAKWAFASKADAEAFRAENGGKIAGFDQALEAAYTDLAKDTKMIRERRKQMKMKMQMKDKHS